MALFRLSELGSLQQFWGALCTDQIELRIRAANGVEVSYGVFDPFRIINCANLVDVLFPNATPHINIFNALANPPVQTTGAPPVPDHSMLYPLPTGSYFILRLNNYNNAPAFWGYGCKKESIMVFPQYLDGITALFHPQRAVVASVRGAAGIGKSVFGLFLMAVVRRVFAVIEAERPGIIDAPTFGYQLPQCFFFLEHDAAGECVVIPEDINVRISEKKGQGCPLILIADSANVTQYCDKVFLNIANVVQRSRSVDAEHNVQIRFDPITREQNIACRRVINADGSDNAHVLELQYDVFGGSLRMMEKSEGPNRGNLVDVDEMILGVIQKFFECHPDFRRAWFIQCLKGCSNLISASLLKLTGPGSVLTLSGLFLHYHWVDEGAECKFASQFLKALFVDLVQTSAPTIADSLKILVGHSGFGFAFEHVSHTHLLKALPGGLTFHSVNNHQHSRAIVVKTKKLTKVFIRSWNDVATLQNDQYGYPVDGRFPLIDGVVKTRGRYIVFQMTVAPSHRSEADEQAFYNTIMAGLPPTPIPFVYLLPSDNYDGFEPDKMIVDNPARWDVRKYLFDDVTGVDKFKNGSTATEPSSKDSKKRKKGN